jgi:hypothetical protein
MENRIKEQQLDLFADRTSCHRFLADLVGHFLSSAACMLVQALRRTALRGTISGGLRAGNPTEALESRGEDRDLGPPAPVPPGR